MKEVFGVYLAPLQNQTAFKIGKSKSPNKRLNELSRFYDFSIKEIIIIDCAEEQLSFIIESCLHKAFCKHNVSMDFDGGTEFYNYTQFREAAAMADLLCKINRLPKFSFQQDKDVQKATSHEKLAVQMAGRIRAKRIGRNISQKDLARLAKVGLRTLQRLEINGQCNLDAMLKIICALKMQDELFKNGFKNSGHQRVRKIFIGLSDHEPEKEGWIYDT